MSGQFTCEDCGQPARLVVDGHPLCDRCGDGRIADATGWPRLPEPRPPESLLGADGRSHRIDYRLLRTPGGISALAKEVGAPPDAGYELSVNGPHTADATALEARLREKVHAALARRFLEVDDRGLLQLAGDVVQGRVVEDLDDMAVMPRVVVDGRSLSWEEFGNLVKPFVGWQFQLQLGDHEEASADDPVELAVVGVEGAMSAGPASAMWTAEHELNEEFDDDALFETWEQEERHALQVLQRAVSAMSCAEPVTEELALACEQLRVGLRRRDWPFTVIRRANGWRRRTDMPADDKELWLECAASLINLSHPSGLPAEEEAAVAALLPADWLGAVLTLVRRGVGASADADDLSRGAISCPEVAVGSDVDEEDDSGLELAFEVVLPTWEAVGAVDDGRRLTALGCWGLPRALARSWGGSLDAEVVAVHHTLEEAPPGTWYLLTDHYERG